MRLFEIIFILVVIATAAILLTRFARRWSIPLTLLGALACVCHIVWEGTHWQMFPVLAGFLLLVIWQLIPSDIRASRFAAVKNRMIISGALLSSASFVLLLLVPMFSLPKPTGPYPVGTRIIYLKDLSRVESHGANHQMPRELIVQVWYPATVSKNHLAPYQRMSETTLATSYRSVLWTNSRVDAPIATDGAPFIVLLFNHRWGGVRTQDTFLTEDLASHGYVVAAIDHTYNAGRVAMPDGRIIQDAFGYEPIDVTKRSADQIREVWNKELTTWVADETFVLTALQNENLDRTSFWYGRLDTSRAGAFGHSFGGSASVQVCSVDARIRSALNLDGWTFGDIRHRAADQPVMYIYGSQNTPRPENLNSKDPVARTEAELDVSDARQIDSSLQQYGGYKLYVNDTSHLDFTDHSLVSPWRNWTERGHIAPSQIQTIVRAYVLAFFDKTLRGEKPALLQSGDSSSFPEVKIEQYTPGSKASPAVVPQPRPDGVGFPRNAVSSLSPSYR
jgi:predicted dienelactone hydrolase